MYVALYRKWRPKLFSDVISQLHVTSTLKNEIKTKKVVHAYVFTGSRGTGKTTCAKIFSKAVNCLNAKKGEPCCECSVCKGLEDGSILDVVEMDGASNNSVNDVRILRDEANFVPASCRYRVYIIDEAHMLSASAFNALLKIMEEPPKYVIFILATTEIHKIPVTILSRCQRFDFKRVRCEDIQNRLMHISSVENFDLHEEAARKISKLADGSVRDAVSILDQCVSATNHITADVVNKVTGLVDKSYILELHKHILNGNATEVVKTIDLLYQNSIDMQCFCSDLVSFYREVMLSLVLDSDSCELLGFDEFFSLDRRELCGDLTISELLIFLELLQSCSESLKNSPNRRLQFEICILKLCLRCSNDISFSKNQSDCLNKKNEKNKNPSSDLTIPDVVELKNNKNHKDSAEINLSGDVSKLNDWPDILDDIRNIDKNGMLSGFLLGSQAFVIEDKLYINSKNSIVAEKILEKKSLICDIIKSRTGKNYRIFLKKSSNAKRAENKLENFLMSAEKAGIAIDEE